jgi:hypothetical protein
MYYPVISLRDYGNQDDSERIARLLAKNENEECSPFAYDISTI